LLCISSNPSLPLSAEDSKGCPWAAAAMADDDTASVGSRSSKYSVKSFMSKASGMASSFSKGMSGMNFSPKTRSTTRSVAAMVELAEGDTCETLSLVTIREEENFNSAVVNEVPPGQTLTVLEVGAGRRVKVLTATGVEGWISSKTKLNEPLVSKRFQEVDQAMEGWEVGGQHEVKSMVTVRTGETLDSDVISELKPGTLIVIKELGVNNKRRAVVDTGAVEGWISLVTKQGELLVGKVSSREKVPSSGMFGQSSSKIKEMLEAARAGELETLQNVLEPGTGIMSKFSNRPNVNASDIRGKTALIYASSFGNAEVVQYLLTKSKELEVNAVDDTDKTALHHASRRTPKTEDDGNLQAEIITLLLNGKAYLEARDHNGCSALMFAVANGNEAVTKRLMLAQANVNTADYEGHTCLSYGVQFKQTRIVALLKKMGAREHLNLDDEDEEEDPGSPSAGRTDVSGTFTSLASAESQGSTMATSSDGGALVDGEVKKKKKKVKAEAAEDATAEASPVKKKKKKNAEDGGEEGDEKKKKKKVKKQNSSSGMQEAMGGDEDAAVTVEADGGEDVDEKERALTKLKAVMESTKSSKELDECIKAAQAAGASDGDVAAAKDALKALKARAKAKDELKNAAEERDVKRLEKALAKAKELKVQQKEIKAAEEVLAVERPKQVARDNLKLAEEAGNADKLKAAIGAAKEAGLDAAEVAAFEDLLAGAESTEKAEAHLRKAIEDRSVSELKFAIQQAKDTGVDATVVAEAEEVLKIEEPKHLAREQLKEACEQISIPALKAAISAAKKAGLEQKEYKQAKKLLEAEELKEKMLKAVVDALEESMKVDMNSIEALREMKEKLSTSIQDALKAGVPEGEIMNAEVRRKKLHNTIEDLKGSIRVFCRVRPLSSKESNAGDTNITQVLDSMSVKVKDDSFSFDAVFAPGTQDEVFEDCKDLVQSAIDGYNVTMFAYGQTGAGKTHTMYGCPGQEGTTPRTVQEIFHVCKEASERFIFTVSGSMLELYRNDLIDLLVKGNASATKTKLNVRQEKTGMINIEHLTEETCDSAEDLMNLLERGNGQRTVAATAMNSQSSRSHLILIIKIVSVNRETKEQLRGKILLCDLAGSERLKKSEAKEDQAKEAIEINKSLTALGDVIEALTKSGKGIIPYRNHKLTQLMQDALGGTAKTLMFVNCSPASSNLDETFMSLKYAQRAKKITNSHKKT